MINRFEEIIAWQKAKILTSNIYKCFKNCRDYSFTDQIKRAAVSVMNNIAEGFERRSNKELSNFLYIAKGSCGEVRSMINLAMELKFLEEDIGHELGRQSEEVSKILSGLIKTL